MIHRKEIHQKNFRRGAPLFAVLLMTLLASCSSSSTKPGSSLSDAETAVARAERVRIGDYDAASWKAAKENLALARANDGSKETEVIARWYAARATADAELGIVRSERARLAAQTLSLKREISALQAPIVTTPSGAPQ